jgi:hypothetical protein
VERADIAKDGSSEYVSTQHAYEYAKGGVKASNLLEQ